jgi:hypothetical protein
MSWFGGFDRIDLSGTAHFDPRNGQLTAFEQN